MKGLYCLPCACMELLCNAISIFSPFGLSSRCATYMLTENFPNEMEMRVRTVELHIYRADSLEAEEMVLRLHFSITSSLPSGP